MAFHPTFQEGGVEKANKFSFDPIAVRYSSLADLPAMCSRTQVEFRKGLNGMSDRFTLRNLMLRDIVLPMANEHGRVDRVSNLDQNGSHVVASGCRVDY